ncbi:hypothetical protein GCM10011391_23370 [Pullulanibacillus camelliae]|uniref:Uncharacterized protein n=1 Tax=Pullulanibacillus camelliae TaxID=1707096 RepID=A0A8J2YHZ5_9BACL|nr:hypothetical protein [Pullulanibacillus camelliae]GGE43875.1 hypothetical protein GCM10011391_23370 [Pullulanibacillus camelliae]
MAKIIAANDATLKITVKLDDALTMIRQAKNNVEDYAHDIITIYEKMPEFDFTYFCFYAYNSAILFETMLGIDPKNYTSFSLEAPDSFFYTLYGGIYSLYDKARQALEGANI